MAHRSFRGRGISQSQRRKKLWRAMQVLPSNFSTGLTSSIGSNQMIYESDAGGSAPVPQEQAQAYVFETDIANATVEAESTVLRIRGSLDMQDNSIGPGQQVEVFGFGIAVFESGAANKGTFPNPATPEGANWDGWMFYRSNQEEEVTTPGGVVDVKAMRKVQSGSSLIFVYGSHVTTFDDSNAPAPALSASFSCRALFLQP